MPPNNSVKNEGQYSDPSTSSQTPSRRSHTRLSARSRSKSLSPRKRQTKQPLHIRMDLTEMQMDRITDAFTHKVSSSPLPSRQRADATPSKLTPRAAKSSAALPEGGYSPSGKGVEMHHVNSPTFSELMPGHNADPITFSLAERRRREPPAPIQVGSGRYVARTPLRPRMEAVSDLVSPLSPTKIDSPRTGYDTEPSLYSPEKYYAAQAGNPNLRDSPFDYNGSTINDDVLEMYKNWMHIRSPENSPESISRRQNMEQIPHRSTRAATELRRLDNPLPPSPLPPRPPPPLAAPRMAAASKADEASLFSPLALYFRGQDFPTVKKGEKTMIGQNGWLERTEKTPNKGKATPQKKASILDSIKKIAKDMSELHHPNRRSQPTTKEPINPQVSISLDAREQSLLYCELEFHLTTALNDYITAELDKGHLLPDNLKKISDGWYQQGRPRVVGFRYDLETQLELVSLHIDEFNFYGRRQSNPAEIAGLLHAMKVNARSMRIRTFCQPDSVIAKQLVDAQSLFNLINVSNSQQIALAEVAQFFKVIIERERDYRGRRTGEKRGSKNERSEPRESQWASHE